MFRDILYSKGLQSQVGRFLWLRLWHIVEACMISVPEQIPTANAAAANSGDSRCSVFWRLLGLVVLTCVAFFTSILDLTLGRAGKMPIQPTYLALGVITLLAGVAAMDAMARRQQGVRMFELFARAAVEGVLYLLIATGSIILGALPGAFWEESGKWILLIPYGFIIWVGTLSIVADDLLREQARRGLVLGYLLLCGSVIWEIFFPGSFSNLEARASGFAGNSNFGALATCMLCSSVLRYGRKESRLRDLLFLSFTLVAVVATQSRSGLIEYVVMLGFWCMSVAFDKSFSVREAARLLGLGVLVLLALTIALAGALRESSLFAGEGNRFSRMLSGKSVDDGSGDERVGAALDAFRLIAEAPILGHGTGHTRTMRVLPHNQYLQQWVNNGAAGLLAYLLMLLAALFNFWRYRNTAGQCFICITLIGSVFSHNVLDQRSFIMTFAILLGYNLLPRVRGKAS